MLDKLVLALVILGGLNWGCIGLFQFDLVGALFGNPSSMISRVILSLVGLASLWSISFYFHRNSIVRTAE